MDVNQMSRKQFEKLPLLDKFQPDDVDSIVLLPTKRHHDSGYNYYYVIPCKDRKPLGICSGYDTFSIYMNSNFNRVGIDCLRGSSLIRIFLPPNEYEIKSMFHEIRKKGD